jgi:hypothetical protein
LKVKKQPKAVRKDRRDFLKVAAAGTATAVAAGSVAAPTQAAIPVAGTGYVETDHVRTYYETCRF